MGKRERVGPEQKRGGVQDSCEQCARHNCAATVEVRALEWPDLQELRLVHDKLETLRKEWTVKVSRPATVFPEADARKRVTSWAAQIASCTYLLSSI